MSRCIIVPPDPNDPYDTDDMVQLRLSRTEGEALRDYLSYVLGTGTVKPDPEQYVLLKELYHNVNDEFTHGLPF